MAQVAFHCCTSLLYLVAVLSRGTLRTCRTRKANRTLDAVATSRTHGTFLSLNIYHINEGFLYCWQSNQHFPQTLRKESLQRGKRVYREFGQKHSQELPFLQQVRVVLGDRCVLSDQWDLQGQQHLFLQGNPVTKENKTHQPMLHYVVTN